ncbi:MAG: cbb3-type cytochrome c oxidase subunit 3 [Rhizobiaceae bacterium]|nr:cbb3-type cytochrome c oxidase subunit 3 [Rhizobiaceae bacterium]
MEIHHESLVVLARSWGLFYLIAMAAGVLVYALWPGNRDRFQRAKTSILDTGDRPVPVETAEPSSLDRERR